MNYYLIANNINITNDIFDKIPKITDEDIIVTFNHCWPINNLSIDNYKNKYHFSRRSFNRSIPYSGLQIISEIKDRFNKIFLYPHPEAISGKHKKPTVDYINSKTNLLISEISHMPGFGKHYLTKETRKFLSSRHNKVSNMSMGLIGYLFIKQQKKQDDNIYLLGFTHQMNKNKHNALGEKEFFLQETDQNLCHIINN